MRMIKLKIEHVGKGNLVLVNKKFDVKTSAEELVPFAWRNPLVADIKKPNKYYRQAVREARSAMLPALRDK